MIVTVRVVLMKVRLFCKKEDYETYKKKLKDGQLEFTDLDADFYIIQKGFMIDSVLGKQDDEYVLLKPEEILYIESLDQEIICTTKDNQKYTLREKLFEFEMGFQKQGFVRISKSYIINTNYIKSIKPTINMRFIVKMINSEQLMVTRSYYYQFKDLIGL